MRYWLGRIYFRVGAFAVQAHAWQGLLADAKNQMAPSRLQYKTTTEKLAALRVTVLTASVAFVLAQQ
jgi:hypothetical protein